MKICNAFVFYIYLSLGNSRAELRNELIPRVTTLPPTRCFNIYLKLHVEGQETTFRPPGILEHSVTERDDISPELPSRSIRHATKWRRIGDNRRLLCPTSKRRLVSWSSPHANEW